ncbi:MAG: phosphoadenylyl-sulfate reductase [Nitrosomonas sp.]|nr:MAG: phosphoadenylyl-sulfate reductase [Nitrosomonas sp.]
MIIMSNYSDTATDHSQHNSAGLNTEAIHELNQRYRSLNFEDRLHKLYEDFLPKKIMVTSSFAATSAYFLHIISRIRPDQIIHFIDTGFHFRETLLYRDYLGGLFHLKIVDLKADDYQHQYSIKEKLYETDPDFCCTINKVNPLEAIKSDYDIWVSSLMSWQTGHRSNLDIFDVRRGIIKFNPMIDVTRRERDAYIREHKLPFHPLVAEGYASIGCVHCTAKGKERCGRWQGKPKTECGLHL